MPYQGEPFVKSVFAAGGDMLYLYGIKSDEPRFLGCMQEEADAFREFELPMDDGMRAYNMTVDAQGNCHILWMSTEQVTLPEADALYSGLCLLEEKDGEQTFYYVPTEKEQ